VARRWRGDSPMDCRVPQCLTIIAVRLQRAIADRDVVPRQDAAMRWGRVDGSPLPQRGLRARTQRSPNPPSSDSILCLTKPLARCASSPRLRGHYWPTPFPSLPTARQAGFVSWATLSRPWADWHSPLMMPGGSKTGT
jgi:hypothetical protein